MDPPHQLNSRASLLTLAQTGGRRVVRQFQRGGAGSLLLRGDGFSGGA